MTGLNGGSWDAGFIQGQTIGVSQLWGGKVNCKGKEANLFSAAISSASDISGGATHGQAGSPSPATQLKRKPSRPTKQLAGPLIANEVASAVFELNLACKETFAARSQKRHGGHIV